MAAHAETEGDAMAEEKLSRPQRPNDLTPFLGKQFIYTYDNGYHNEFYIKNDHTVDYRIHGGTLKGRWVRDQEANIVPLASDIVKVSWEEPAGTVVSIAIMLSQRLVHGSIYFPRWIAEDPRPTVCYQNDHLDRLKQLRDAGPTFPRMVVNEFATITFVEDRGQNNEEVIACAPDQLPEGYANRQNV
jgi:phenolic acid decarboxylase